MANPTTPRGMLELFRQELDPFTADHVRLFNAMPVKERVELLMHMSVHNNRIVQQLHGKLDPEAAKTVEMPDPQPKN